MKRNCFIATTIFCLLAFSTISFNANAEDILMNLAEDESDSPQWTWMLLPNASGGNELLNIDVDLLSVHTERTFDESQLLAEPTAPEINGQKWKVGPLVAFENATELGNLNDTLNNLGFAEGDIDNKTVYAQINIKNHTEDPIKISVFMTIPPSEVIANFFLNGSRIYEAHVRARAAAENVYRDVRLELQPGDNHLVMKSSHAVGTMWSVGLSLHMDPKKYAEIELVASQTGAQTGEPSEEADNDPFGAVAQELLGELIENDMDYYHLGADVTDDDQLNEDDVAIIRENWEDIANGREPYEGNERLDVNRDGKINIRDLQLVEFALKLDVNGDGEITFEDAEAMAEMAEFVGPIGLVGPIGPAFDIDAFDIDGDGLPLTSVDQLLVNTAVKYAIRTAIPDPDVILPENLITEVAYGENSTYFVLNPQFAQILKPTDHLFLNSPISYKSKITLYLPDTEKITKEEFNEGNLPDKLPYFMIPLSAPKKASDIEVNPLMDAAAVFAQGVALEIVGLIDKWGLISGFLLFKDTWETYKNSKQIEDDIYEEVRSGFANPEVTIRAPEQFFTSMRTGWGVANPPDSILFMIPKRIVGIQIEIKQHYCTQYTPVLIDKKIAGMNATFKLEGDINKTVGGRLANPTFTKFLEHELNRTDSKAPKGDIKDVFTHFLVAVENTTVGNLRVKDLSTTVYSEFRAPGPKGDTIEFINSWVLGPTLAAPEARPMSLADYPPFQQLSPEVQEYLLQHFEGHANTAGTKAETYQIPEKTSLLPNYPNPFNPETWIPYQLTKPAEVTLTIYDINGHVVRNLALGHQRAGVYQSKSRAAYWDGRNAVGEPVASGVYFYTLKAGDFTATRKLLVRK